MVRVDVIQDEIKRQKLSVVELANRTGLTRPTIYNLLKDGKPENTPRLETIEKIVTQLGLKITDVIAA